MLIWGWAVEMIAFNRHSSERVYLDLKGQSSVEYIIILAFVIAITLIVVGVLGGIVPLGSGTSISSAKLQLAALDLGIHNYKQDSHSTLLQFRNNNNFPIRIEHMWINDKQCTLHPYHAVLGPGQKRKITCYGVVGINEGNRYGYGFNITYKDVSSDTQYVLTPDVDLVGKIAQGSEIHTGQQSCYEGDIGETKLDVCTSSHAGQDAFEDGMPKLFTTLFGNIIRDDHTKLMWITNESVSEVDEATALTYCDGVNNGGYDDWRLPNTVELLTVLGSSADMSGINNPSPNGNTWADGIYWTSTVDINDVRFFIVIRSDTDTQGSFTGVPEYWGGISSAYVVCVRGVSQSIALTDGLDSTKQFIDIGDGTVVDADTGIVWEKADSSSTMPWKDSGNYCSEQNTGGYADWRLPTASEAATIIDYAVADYKNDVFTWSDLGYLGYHTGTTTSDIGGVAYLHDMVFGIVSNDLKYTDYYVRCVRNR